MDIVKSAQKFGRETIGCAVFVSSDIAQRDKFIYCLIKAIPSTRECLLCSKLVHLFVFVCVFSNILIILKSQLLVLFF